MSDHTTRRGFLRKTAAAGGCLAVPGLGGAGRIAQSAEDKPGGPVQGAMDPVVDSPIAVNVPIAVVTQSVSRDINARAGTWAYITEILQRAGVFFEELP
ncbi:MAG: twin-arginine translocation signal domain-containing protein, partial [Planctomycetota bacterium]